MSRTYVDMGRNARMFRDSELEPYRQRRVVCRHGDWTVIVDPAIDPNRVFFFNEVEVSQGGFRLDSIQPGDAIEIPPPLRAEFDAELVREGMEDEFAEAAVENSDPTPEEVPERPKQSYDEWLASTEALLAENARRHE